MLLYHDGLKAHPIFEKPVPLSHIMGASKAITIWTVQERLVIRLRSNFLDHHVFGTTHSPKQLKDSPCRDCLQTRPSLAPVLRIGLGSQRVKEKHTSAIRSSGTSGNDSNLSPSHGITCHFVGMFSM